MNARMAAATAATKLATRPTGPNGCPENPAWNCRDRCCWSFMGLPAVLDGMGAESSEEPTVAGGPKCHLL